MLAGLSDPDDTNEEVEEKPRSYMSSKAPSKADRRSRPVEDDDER